MTLHEEILGDLTGRILSGEWPPGHQVPFEVDLAKQYQCSRMTVNKVMTQLSAAGLIERHRRLGSFVRRPKSQSAVLEIHDIETEVKALGLPYGYELLSRQNNLIEASAQNELGVNADISVVQLRAIHHGGERPFCFEERLISEHAVPEVASADFSISPPGQWLLAQVPWSSAEHRVRAVSVSNDIAQALRIAKGEACLVIERRTWSNSQPVTFVRFTYPADGHVLVATFTPTA